MHDVHGCLSLRHNKRNSNRQTQKKYNNKMFRIYFPYVLAWTIQVPRLTLKPLLPPPQLPCYICSRSSSSLLRSVGSPPFEQVPYPARPSWPGYSCCCHRIGSHHLRRWFCRRRRFWHRHCRRCYPWTGTYRDILLSILCRLLLNFL